MDTWDIEPFNSFILWSSPLKKKNSTLSFDISLSACANFHSDSTKELKFMTEHLQNQKKIKKYRWNIIEQNFGRLHDVFFDISGTNHQRGPGALLEAKKKKMNCKIS